MAVAITRTANEAGAGTVANEAVWNSVSIGTSSDDRIVVAVVTWEDPATLSDVSMVWDGVNEYSMTAGPSAKFGSVGSSIWYLHVPSSETTSQFRATFSEAVTATADHLTVYVVTGASIVLSNSGTDTSTDMDVTDPLTTGSVTIPTDGGFLGAAAGATDTTTKTWANATEDLDEDVGTFRNCTSTRTTSGTVTITCTGTSNNEDGALAWVIFKPGQWLLPSLYTDSDTFYTPKVSHKIYPSLYADGDTFHTPTVASGVQELNPSLFSDGDTFFSPNVIQKIFPSLHSDADTFFSPQLNLKIFPSLFNDGDTFYTHSVSGIQALFPSLFVNTQLFPPEPPIDTFWQHTVISGTGQNLAPDLFSDGDTFYTPTVTPGAVNLSPSLFTNTNTFYTPSVIQLVKPSLYSDADTFFAPTVTRGAVNLSPSLFSDADTFFTHTVTSTVNLSANLLSDGDTFFSPSVIQKISPSLYTDADTFFTSTITRGGVTLLPSLYSDADTFYTHDVSGALKPNLYSDPDTFYAPSISMRIYPALLSDADTFYTHSLVQFQGLDPSLFVNTNSFFTHSIAQFDVRDKIFNRERRKIQMNKLPIYARFR
jgi:hypothetical protein